MQTQPTSIGKFNTFGTGPLALEQFLSVFLLLGIGVLVATAFVFCERAYANCVVKRVFGVGPGAVNEEGGVGGKKGSAGSIGEKTGKKPPPACLQLLSQNMGLPYSRTFYRAHKRDSKIRLLDHITSSFNFYDNASGNTISDYHHGFLESFVLRKMITCNDPICQRNFVKLENELKKCLVRLRQIENWGRMCYLEGGGSGTGQFGGVRSGGGGGGTIKNPPASLMRTRISTIERNHDEIVGRRICGDYSDYSIFSGVMGGSQIVGGGGLQPNVDKERKRSSGGSSRGGGGGLTVGGGVFRDEVIGVSSRKSARSTSGSEFGSRRELGSGNVRVSVSDVGDEDDEDDSVMERDGGGTSKVGSKRGSSCDVVEQINQIIKVAEIETVL